MVADIFCFKTSHHYDLVKVNKHVLTSEGDIPAVARSSLFLVSVHAVFGALVYEFQWLEPSPSINIIKCYQISGCGNRAPKNSLCLSTRKVDSFLLLCISMVVVYQAFHNRKVKPCPLNATHHKKVKMCLLVYEEEHFPR